MPINEAQEYSVFIPHSKEIDANTLCDWKPLVMVHEYSLKENIVQVKFTNAPQNLGVSHYFGVLSKMISIGEYSTVDKQSVLDMQGQEMLRASFYYVDYGNYSIDIQASHVGGTCSATSTVLFHVPVKIKDVKHIVYIIMLAIIVILFAVAIFFTVRWGFKQGYFGSVKKICVVYSCDTEHHVSLVQAFINVLKCMKYAVSSNYGPEMIDPSDWLWKCYQESDVILIVISYGVYHKTVCDNCPKLLEPGCWDDRFTPAIITLREEIENNPHFLKNKKVCKVYFGNSSIQDIPENMQRGIWGKMFALPEEMDELVYFIDHAKSGKEMCCLDIQRPDCSSIHGMDILNQCVLEAVDAGYAVNWPHNCRMPSASESISNDIDMNLNASDPKSNLNPKKLSDSEDDSECMLQSSNENLFRTETSSSKLGSELEKIPKVLTKSSSESGPTAVLLDHPCETPKEKKSGTEVFDLKSCYIPRMKPIVSEFWKKRFESDNR